MIYITCLTHIVLSMEYRNGPKVQLFDTQIEALRQLY
jgi:hypothetical protein